MSLYLGNTIISGVATPIDGSIAIGQIISSIIPLTDAGLHLLDGSIIQGGGIYDDFVQYIAGLSSSYPSCFTDETTWQNTVSSKGACGKFVYDSTNNTVRLPKITGFIEGTIDSNALGDLVNAGLPNITGITGGQYIRNGSEDAQGTGALVNGNTIPATIAPGDGWWATQLNFDASQSNSIYGNSTTVQPQSIKVFYYIVIATTTKTNIEVDIDEVITDLNAINSSVVHKTGNETISGEKIFTGYAWITRFQSTNVTYNTAPSSDESTTLAFIDKNGTQMGVVECFRFTDNSTAMQLNTYGSNGNWSSHPLQLRVFPDGYTVAYAPTPYNNSYGNEIATAAYVNNKFQVVSTLPANPDSNVFYFIPE
jgi:hypothetical protein